MTHGPTGARSSVAAWGHICTDNFGRRDHMESTRYLIVGGGMTGDAAVKGIRERDADGSIVLVGAEQHPPYAAPPLTKGLWSGTDESKIWRGTEAAGADLRLGRRIVSLDLEGRRATDDVGDEYAWEKLLLATGGRPRRIPGTDGVVYYRTLDDYRAVRARARGRARRRDRRRLHRFGDRGVPGGERLPGHDGLPGARDRVARPAGGALRLCDGRLPKARRRDAVGRDRGAGVPELGHDRLRAHARGGRRHRRSRHRAPHRAGRGVWPRGRQRDRRRRARPRRGPRRR